MEVYSSIVSFFQDGGVFMYPIVIVFTLGLAIAVERWGVSQQNQHQQQGAVEKDHAVYSGPASSPRR